MEVDIYSLLKEKTLELEHNHDNYTFAFIFSKLKYSKIPFNAYVSSSYFFIFDISFFLRDNNGNKSVQLFCAIPVVIDFLIAFHNSLIIL